ncbi:hypothetical protein SAMN00017477_1905 [Peptoniphilus asaccharolyticus DSM 20463]|uniref:N-acetyltransferase domain-containing protein n=1 Tax=Peptoniphilus asaccharolyticus DSM 20463 TaxID=573058 RepID=A0A1W1VFJ5_PEPAS|nr:GNAT family N-acetyltransferase [Peptoniphilus asaccharolyticus]MBL7575872.1 N-acetyltransferase [Peptoniphilus asaccharolyticus]SMB92157.1 hypothetical protein SAMN00017477_1905 [Peptoniphilus asaccharolyticus DSM 20463]
MEVKRGQNCYYIGESEQDYKGILTYVERDGKIDAEHTIVKPEFGGQGLAGELVKKLIEDARAENKKIIPTCSYVNKKLSATEFDDIRA